MTQPFRNSFHYHSSFWPQVQIDYKIDHVVIRTEDQMMTFSSALWGGGLTLADHFVNWKVPINYHSVAPQKMMREQIQTWRYPIESTIGLQTAAKLSHTSIHSDEGDQFRMICCATAGTSNAARAGRPYKTYSAYQFGTINIFLLIDGKLSDAAKVNAIMTATEAKVAALQDLLIMDHSGQQATGTTTDSIVLAVSENPNFSNTHQFAGVSTSVGNAIGRLVYDSVYESVLTQKDE